MRVDREKAAESSAGQARGIVTPGAGHDTVSFFTSRLSAFYGEVPGSLDKLGVTGSSPVTAHT
jgi:hypothetical protein